MPQASSRLVAYCKGIFETNRNYKFAAVGPNHENWKIYEDWYQSFARGADKRKRVPDVPTNLIRPAVELGVSALVGEEPDLYFSPQESDDIDFATDLTDLHSDDWASLFVAEHLNIAVRDRFCIGVGFLHDFYDPILGRDITEQVSSRSLYVAPGSDPMLATAENIVHLSMIPLRAALKKYPRLLQMKPMKDAPDTMQDAVDAGRIYNLGEAIPIPYGERGTPMVAPTESGQSSVESGDAKVVVAQFWFRACRQIAHMFGDEDKAAYEKFEQDSGVVTIIGDAVADFMENPYMKHIPKARRKEQLSVFPYTPIRAEGRSLNWWPKSPIEDAIPPQRAINFLISGIAEHAQKTIRPPYIFNRRMGSHRPQELSWNDDNIYDVDGGTEALRPLQYDTLSLGYLRLIEQLRQMINLILGTSDSSQGMRQPGVPTAAGVRQLQGVFYARNEPARNSMGRSMARHGELWTNIAMSRYEKSRVASALGEDRARSWAERIKGKLGAFDVRPVMGKEASRDPASTMQLLVELQKLGTFKDDPATLEERIALLENVQHHLPNARRLLERLYRQRRAAEKAERSASLAPPPAQGPQPAPQPEVPEGAQLQVA